MGDDQIAGFWPAAFTAAFRSSALLPILAMAFAAAACLAVRSRAVVQGAEPAAVEELQTIAV